VWVGKNLALLQAEASACVLELANVPNVGWPIILCFSCSKIFIIVVRFFGLLVTVQCKNNSRLWGALFLGYTKVDARHKP